MIKQRVRNIIRKEWAVIFSDLNNTLMISIIPVLIVAQGLLYVWLASHFGGEAILSSSLFLSALEKLRAAIPAVAGLETSIQMQVLLLEQFNFYLLLIPLTVAMMFATFTIVDEKTSRSLEPLLATPVRTWELLMGKTLAGALPAIAAMWVSAGVFFLGVTIMGWGNLIGLVITPVWLVSLLLLNPVIALLSIMLGVIGSSRAKDARNAQNLVGVIILPLFGLIAIQVIGVVWFTAPLMLALVAGLAVIDYLVLRVAVGLFQRETIILKWR